jgi:hypothetical protein
MLRFASSTIFTTAFLAEVGENLGNLDIISPVLCTPAQLTESEDRHFHGHTQAWQFALCGWPGPVSHGQSATGG